MDFQATERIGRLALDLWIDLRANRILWFLAALWILVGCWVILHGVFRAPPARRSR